MRNINVDKMSLKELVDLEARVKNAIAVAKERERGELKKRIESMAKDSGFSVDELFVRGRSTTKGRTVAPKYINPENSSETWSGRGRKPKWLVAKLGKGAKIEDFAI
jgi:DNA-binding protein H-NS